MLLYAPDDPRPVHFVGIAGAGMSALALIARRRGVTVTGCDADLSGAADVAQAGARLCRGHDPGHVVGARAVVYTAAVASQHPELEAARAAGLPVVRRADALQQLVSGGEVVAVAGTHGKTTTTVMTTDALAAAGRDPTGIAGGRVASWGRTCASLVRFNRQSSPEIPNAEKRFTEPKETAPPAIRFRETEAHSAPI